LDLAVVANTPLDGINLVLKPDSLTCGAAYRFTLTAVDAASPPEGVSAYIDLEVNMPPTGGRLVCSSSEGYVLSTKFDFKAEDWQDDDPPLLYQLKYRIVGGNSTAWTPIGSPTPDKEFSKQLPVAGLAAFDHLVSLQLTVKDNLEGVTTSVVNVTVNEMMTEQMDDEEKDALLGGLLASSANDLANGDVEASMVMVTGLAHMANADPEAEARRRRRRPRRRLLSGGSDSDAHAGEDIRGIMMGMVGTALSVLPPSMETLDWMAETAATVVDSPTAVSASTRDSTFGVLSSLVAQVNTTEQASMAPSAAASVTHGLNSLMLSMGAEVTRWSDSEEEWEEELDSEYAAAESEEVTRNAAQAVGLLNEMATSLVNGLAPGEAPQELVSDTLTAKVQNAGALDSPACPLFGGALEAAGGAGAVTLPSSLKDAGMANAGDAVVLRMVSVAVSPHIPNASNAANATTTKPGSGVLTIALESASSSQPLVVQVSCDLPFHSPASAPCGVGMPDSASSACGQAAAVETRIALNGTAGAQAPYGSADVRSGGSLGRHQLPQDGYSFSLSLRSDGPLDVCASAQGLADPIEFSLPLTAQTAAEVSAVSCLYWDENSQTYSGDGCVAQPNPAPPGVFLYWKAGAALPRDINGSVLLDEAWAIGGLAFESDWSSDFNSDWMSSESTAVGMLEGCVEVFDAYFEEYDGADARLRKFVGDGCELSRANNTVLCWWDWRRQTFTGPGCVLADTLQCMCTHLTDFQAGMNMGKGELKAPDVAVFDPGAMTSLSLSDVAESSALLIVLGAMVGVAVVGFSASQWVRNRTRMRVLRSLVFTAGRTHKDTLWFLELEGGVWTWDLDDPPPHLTAVVDAAASHAAASQQNQNRHQLQSVESFWAAFRSGGGSGRDGEGACEDEGDTGPKVQLRKKSSKTPRVTPRGDLTYFMQELSFRKYAPFGLDANVFSGFDPQHSKKIKYIGDACMSAPPPRAAGGRPEGLTFGYAAPLSLALLAGRSMSPRYLQDSGRVCAKC
jgi:hypothetical protein